MDSKKYFTALSKVLDCEHERTGIGTYSEKTVHAVLKNYFEPNTANQEQKVGKYVADILTQEGIIEIQTGSFDRLRGKLNEFLKENKVTVVYPIEYRKWLIPIDPETGAEGKRRKSPRSGTVYDIFKEMYKIKPLINNDNLNFCIMMLDIDEYRCPPSESRSHRRNRKGYSRFDRIPTALHDEIYLSNADDWSVFIPPGLPDEYTSADFARKAKIRLPAARLALNILTYKGIVTRTGKSSNNYLYKTNVQI